jgi:hypothetical protein
MADLRQELTELLDRATWEWLAPHADRDAVIIVAPQLALVDVGVAIVQDQSQSVQHWIAEALLVKPTIDQKVLWDKQNQQLFAALIVQPYVLIQVLIQLPDDMPNDDMPHDVAPPTTGIS